MGFGEQAGAGFEAVIGCKVQVISGDSTHPCKSLANFTALSMQNYVDATKSIDTTCATSVEFGSGHGGERGQRGRHTSLEIEHHADAVHGVLAIPLNRSCHSDEPLTGGARQSVKAGEIGGTNV